MCVEGEGGRFGRVCRLGILGTMSDGSVLFYGNERRYGGFGIVVG